MFKIVRNIINEKKNEFLQNKNKNKNKKVINLKCLV